MSAASLLRRAPGWHVLRSAAAALRVEVALRRRSLAGTAADLGLVVEPAASHLDPSAHPAGRAGPPRLPRWTAEPVRATASVMRWWPLGQDGPRGSAMCLRSSLVTARRLRSLDPTVRIGVALEAGELLAHAWVEVDGVALDPTAGRYRVMTSLVPTGRAHAQRPARRTSAA